MPVPALPLELQLYIIKLAAPLHEMTRRRETLKSCSLVHHSWTPTAQKLLFQHLKHALRTKLYMQTPYGLGRLVEEDDDRLAQRLSAAPSSGNGQQWSFEAASIRISQIFAHGEHAALKAIAHTISSLCIYWLVKADDDSESRRLSQWFPNLKHLLYLGYPVQRDLLLPADDSTTPFDKVQSLTLINTNAERGRLQPRRGRSVQAWPSLTRIALKDAALVLESTSLAAWAPNLDLFFSHVSTPSLNTVVTTAPPKLRIAVFAIVSQDLPTVHPVQLPATLELLHVLVLVDLDRYGRVATSAIEAVEKLHIELLACGAGSPNLVVVKVETVPKRASETADEVFQEVADRYGLLR